MVFVIVAAAISVTVLPTALAQDNRSTALQFEVASIKLADSHSERGAAGGPGRSDPTRYSFNSATLLDLISIAYHVEYFQVISKTPLAQQQFDFVAKLPPGTTRPQLRVMLQNFLNDRFALATRMEARNFPGYVLMITKNGPKLNETETNALGRADSRSVDDTFPVLPPDRPGFASKQSRSNGGILVRARARQQTMANFAEWLQETDGHPVRDQTDLSGKYDFLLEFWLQTPSLPAEGSIDPSGVPDLNSALQQQLGLQLGKKDLPFNVVVVDHVRRLPTEN
jgi:uncharacterized protein (TIGR03435 family)